MSTSLSLSSTAVGWHLESPEDLATALNEAQGLGYRGGIMVGPPSLDGTVTWMLELNPPEGVGATATIGQWVVHWSGRLMVLTPEQFTAAGFTTA